MSSGTRSRKRESLSQSEERRLCEAYLDGLTFRDLLARFRVGEKRVYQVLQRYGVDLRHRTARAGG